MGSSPKSLRSKGRLSNAGSPPKAQRRISLALLWMAAALAVVGLFHLETMYAMTGLHAWKRSASGAKDGSGSDGEPAASSVIPPTALLLATHTRLLWYDPLTDTSQILHEGEVSLDDGISQMPAPTYLHDGYLCARPWIL